MCFPSTDTSVNPGSNEAERGGWRDGWKERERLGGGDGGEKERQRQRLRGESEGKTVVVCVKQNMR